MTIMNLDPPTLDCLGLELLRADGQSHLDPNKSYRKPLTLLKKDEVAQ